jgi:hypothetical protein
MQLRLLKNPKLIEDRDEVEAAALTRQHQEDSSHLAPDDTILEEGTTDLMKQIERAFGGEERGEPTDDSRKDFDKNSIISNLIAKTTTTLTTITLPLTGGRREGGGVIGEEGKK